jgi:hypothetical protein
MGDGADEARDRELAEWLEELLLPSDPEIFLNSCPGCGKYFELCICNQRGDEL